jgi:hypothetical protein
LIKELYKNNENPATVVNDLMVIDPSNIKIIYTEYSSTNNPATE